MPDARHGSIANLGPELASLPAPLADRVANETGLPSREVLSTYLSSRSGMGLRRLSVAAGVARQRQRSRCADGPLFVLHDTSGPNFGHRSFPEEVDDGTSKINSLNKFRCSDGSGKAHVVINRSGGMLLNHELEIPWRETKFEQAANFSGALKGLFLMSN